MQKKSKKSLLSKIFNRKKTTKKTIFPKTTKISTKSLKKLKKVAKPVKKSQLKKKTPKVTKVKTPSRSTAKPKKVVSRKTSAKKTTAPHINDVQEQVPSSPLHHPVMVEEVFEALSLPGKKVIVDGTLGLGGHTHEILSRINGELRMIGFDVDDENLKLAQEKLKPFKDQVVFIRNNFKALQEELQKLKIRTIDALLLDLGLSSPQVDIGERGFSFLREGPLDMRFDKTQQLTAEEVINKYSEKELLRIFREYGEEPKARKIVQEIIRRRRRHPFKTTTELADFIEKLMGRKGHIHPATRIFQALRIEVNKELETLQSALEQAVDMVKKGGRIVVIAYHSLEDRLVKNFFKNHARDFVNIPGELKTTMLEPKLKIITKKPLTPSHHELNKNPRSRSAKLRVAERL